MFKQEYTFSVKNKKDNNEVSKSNKNDSTFHFDFEHSI